MDESLVNPLVYAFLRGFLRVFVIIVAFLVAWWLFNRRYPLEPYEPYFQFGRKSWKSPEPPPPEYSEYVKEHSTPYFLVGGVSTRMVSGFKQGAADGTHP